MGYLSLKTRSQVYANLEKYARSGMGMEKACESLLSQPGVGATERQIYKGILQGLSEGLSIGESLSKAGGAVSSLEQKVVIASERGGRLEKGFAHLAEYFRRVYVTRRKVIKGLGYPILLLHMVIPISLFATSMFQQAMPHAEATDLGTTLGATVGRAGWWFFKIYLVAAVLLLGVFFLRRWAKYSAAVDLLLNRVPIMGKARKMIALERFCQVFEIYLLSGLRMSDALEGAGDATSSGLISNAATRGAKTVADGFPLAEAIFAAPRAFPNDFARGMAAAEESGMLDRELNQWGKFYSESAADAMDQVAEWTPKIFYWLVVFFVAYMIIKVGLAYRHVLDGWINLEL